MGCGEEEIGYIEERVYFGATVLWGHRRVVVVGGGEVHIRGNGVRRRGNGVHRRESVLWVHRTLLHYF